MLKNVTGDSWISASRYDEYGGVSISIQAGYELQQMMVKLREHLEEHEREKALRNSDPSVKLAWDSYKMAVAMAEEQV